MSKLYDILGLCPTKTAFLLKAHSKLCLDAVTLPANSQLPQMLALRPLVGDGDSPILKRKLTDGFPESSDDEIDSDIVIPSGSTIAVCFCLISVLALEGSNVLGIGRNLRKGNVKRDRRHILKWSYDIDDNMFRRQFRLHREDFYYVLLKIQSVLEKSEKQACNSSGSSVSPYLMLMITLRILAGASYLDMVHYHVHVDSVNKLVWSAVCAISKKVDNIKVARNEYECLKLTRDWSVIQKQRWGTYLAAGTIYAGDGLVLEILQSSEAELKGRAVTIFRNRKGLWELIAQGFCDAHTRFCVLDVKWPGGTNDVVAYRMTDLCMKAESGYFPAWATFVLDEAYSSCGGMHLTPFSVHQLR